MTDTPIIKPPQERDNLDLLELVCQLHSRAIAYPSEEMHNAYLEAREELEKRLQPKEVDQNEWQLCPKCNGTGNIRTIGKYASTTSFIQCDVCFGAKVLAKPFQLKREGDAVELKNILREFIMRGNYGFPMNERDLEWFETGIKGKTKEGADFLIRLFELSGIEAEARKEDV